MHSHAKWCIGSAAVNRWLGGWVVEDKTIQPPNYLTTDPFPQRPRPVQMPHVVGALVACKPVHDESALTVLAFHRQPFRRPGFARGLTRTAECRDQVVCRLGRARVSAGL